MDRWRTGPRPPCRQPAILVTSPRKLLRDTAAYLTDRSGVGAAIAAAPDTAVNSHRARGGRRDRGARRRDAHPPGDDPSMVAPDQDAGDPDARASCRRDHRSPATRPGARRRIGRAVPAERPPTEPAEAMPAEVSAEPPADASAETPRRRRSACRGRHRRRHEALRGRHRGRRRSRLTVLQRHDPGRHRAVRLGQDDDHPDADRCPGPDRGRGPGPRRGPAEVPPRRPASGSATCPSSSPSTRT